MRHNLRKIYVQGDRSDILKLSGIELLKQLKAKELDPVVVLKAYVLGVSFMVVIQSQLFVLALYFT